jgi:putative hemolysin
VNTLSSPPGRSPFHLPEALANRLAGFLRGGCESLLALPRLNEIYLTLTGWDASSGGGFSQRALDLLDVRDSVSDTEVARIPATGPLVVVANHPFGGVDGLLLSAVLQRVRPDVKLLANRFLDVVPELRETCFFVDAFGGSLAARRNAAALRQALRWVKGGGVVAIFPAGEVSHFSVRNLAVADRKWAGSVGRFIRQAQAPVLPVFFEGRNSLLFQAAGLVHPRLRTVLLPRELLKKCQSTVDLRIGSVIPAARLARYRGDELAAYLRVRTYLLRGRVASPSGISCEVPLKAPRLLRPVAAPEPVDQVAAEVAALPATSRIARSGDLSVYSARAAEVPTVLAEIGRLRELAFRAVGEGSGGERDLDRFDDHYRHLFVWNEQERAVVGAYRLGATDEIVARFGLDGLYTRTLFRYDSRLLRQIGPALELGRSFVRPEYQKEYAPLLLLWKGIAGFVAANPRYKMLFGPVSISNDYHCLSKQLLVAFLRLNRYLPNLGYLVRPRNAPRLGRFRDWDEATTGTVVRDIDDVDELVAEVQAERRGGVPVLLRQYLKLNAKLLGLNVDSQFGDVLDALMLVDLTQVNRAILARYMGAREAERFLAHHAAGATVAEEFPNRPGANHSGPSPAARDSGRQ